ncbi:MAG: ABC transporter substrate-binding protein [Acetobacteraceae bacterium]
MKSFVVGLLLLALAGPAWAQLPDTLRIGVLTDETGPYADSAGAGSVAAAKMAVADFGGTVRGHKIEIVDADTQNKPDVAATIARRWFDNRRGERGGGPAGHPGGAGGAADRQGEEPHRHDHRLGDQRVHQPAPARRSARTGRRTRMRWRTPPSARCSGTAARVGSSSPWTWRSAPRWRSRARAVVMATGGTVIGDAKHAIGATDYASQLLAAQASGAQVIALASVEAGTWSTSSSRRTSSASAWTASRCWPGS